MARNFPFTVESLLLIAPEDWLTAACEALRGFPLTASSDFVLQHLPDTNNSDLSFQMASVVRSAFGKMSWEALSWVLAAAFATHYRWQAQRHEEHLWSGPSPANKIPGRRIDQALYDLIANAKREILMVTFAAAKIDRLVGVLWKAGQGGVRIRLILEFEQTSEGQLSYDALKAFPAALIGSSEIYYWPVEKRERNQAGRPGKLHAKVAIVDEIALVSSANLTDDAFNRNLELGIMVRSSEFISSTKRYFESLIAEGTLKRL
jgi:phosphatidylserine/phosphatidylglycerophosphate/cardiolipin synthase-like enzyme